MTGLKVALLQIMPEGSQEANLAKGISACREAKKMGADIALFPEMWNTGYDIPQDAAALEAMVISRDSEFINAFADLARELDMAIGITFLESHSPRPRNSLCLFDRKGNLALHYAKVHTCDFGDECMLDGGDDFYVCDLDVGDDTVKVGAMICYDREFPESARILMLKGAELILVPNACPMEINRLSQLRGRAYENMLGIATCNYPSPKPDCNGHSSAYDGIAYREDVVGSCDTEILLAPETEGIYIADFALDDIRDYRNREVHGNAYRRPQMYHKLIDEEILPPFVRSDRKK